MQLILNEQELDLNVNEKVTLTLQVNDLSDISKANTAFTNAFKIPKTANNIKVFEYLGINGSSSRLPYVLNNVSMIENSIFILENGYAEVTECDDKNYSINIYGAEKNFFEKVKNVTLKDVFPDMPIVWDAAHLNQYINSNEMICFPVSQYNTETYHTPIEEAGGFFPTYTVMEILQSTPHFFVKYLFESIFKHLGYTLIYPIANDPVFTNLLIPCQKGVSHFVVNQGATFNLRNCVHEIGCDVLIKEILFRFGMSFTCDESRKEARFTQLNTLIKSGTRVDWSRKYDTLKSIKYNLQGYARTNYFLYSEDVVDSNYSGSTENELRGAFQINNELLPLESTVIESSFVKALMWGNTITEGHNHGTISFSGDIGTYHLFNVAENELTDKGEIKLRENPFQLMYLKTLPGTIQFHMRETTGNNIYLVTPRVCTNDFLSFQYFIDTHYTEIVNLFDNMMFVKATMKLDLLDVYRFDFFKRYYLEQFGAYFYVNKISNWQNNKLVEVELIKIPPVIS